MRNKNDLTVFKKLTWKLTHLLGRCHQLEFSSSPIGSAHLRTAWAVAQHVGCMLRGWPWNQLFDFPSEACDCASSQQTSARSRTGWLCVTRRADPFPRCASWRLGSLAWESMLHWLFPVYFHQAIRDSNESTSLQNTRLLTPQVPWNSPFFLMCKAGFAASSVC